MANPRDHIRAAQAAELRGDKPAAAAELRKAAGLYQRAGSTARALQLLRHARSLDPEQEGLEGELRRLEGLAGSPAGQRLEPEEPRAEAAVLELMPEPEAQAERQRLMEEALRQVGLSASDTEVQEEVRRWLVEDPPGGRGPVDLQEASRRALEWALRHPSEEERLPRAWPLDPGEEALEVRAMAAEDVTALVAEVAPGFSGHPFEPLAGPALPTPEEPVEEEPREREERALIERGPTRADPALEAWCSFCCLPRTEVGELVAGPTGSFICAGCVGESGGLLGLEGQAAARPRAPRRREEHAEATGLVGQREARDLLERGLEAGARRVLVVGPVGTGKSTWFRELVRLERGALVTLEALEQGSGGPVVLLEDVDRLPPEAQERLGAFLARHPERTVLMSARGSLRTPQLVLEGEAGSLPVFSTQALSEGVAGAVPLALLERVQVAVALQVPSQEEFAEIARQRLAPRASEFSLKEEVLAAIAAEAARSPRAGHELSALLSRVLPGAWSLIARKGEE